MTLTEYIEHLEKLTGVAYECCDDDNAVARKLATKEVPKLCRILKRSIRAVEVMSNMELEPMQHIGRFGKDALKDIEAMLKDAK